MKRILQIFAVFFAAAVFSGCSKIPDYSLAADNPSDLSENEQSSEAYSGISDTFSTSDYVVIKQNFLSKLNAEGGVFEEALLREDGEFDGKGFLSFGAGGRLTHIVNANTPQFYRVIIAARSKEGAAVKLCVKKKVEGAFYVTASKEDDESFGYFAVDSIYLTSGSNVLDFVVEKGSVDIDYILVENSDRMSSDCYRVGTSSVNPSASLETVGMIKYLAEIYGSGSLTAANVSLGTNAEIDAIYKATGRYPAIRTSELANAVFDSEVLAENMQKDVQLALDWAKSGGIVSYKWHWYSPNTKRSTSSGAFDMEEALSAQNLEDIALMTEDELKFMIENGFLSPNIISLINDIDRIAAVLKSFNDKKIPVLFEPIGNPDSGMYWWGDNAQFHGKLYHLIFDRLCRYHKLSNLVWVWTGGNADYYPGTSYCDVIGQSFFENSNSTFAGRFSSIVDSYTIRKPICATSRDVLPSADLLHRDNVLWLWSALESGKYVIKENGALSTEYNSLSSLNSAYNSEIYITRDELPDLKNYALT